MTMNQRRGAQMPDVDELMDKVLQQDELIKQMRQLDPTHRCAKGDVLVFVLGQMTGTLYRIRAAAVQSDASAVLAAVEETLPELMRWTNALGLLADAPTPALVRENETLRAGMREVVKGLERARLGCTSIEVIELADEVHADIRKLLDHGGECGMMTDDELAVVREIHDQIETLVLTTGIQHSTLIAVLLLLRNIAGVSDDALRQMLATRVARG